MLLNCKIVRKRRQIWGLLHGGFLMLCRWLIIYPLVYFLYELRGLQRSPWRMNPNVLPTHGGILVIVTDNLWLGFLLGHVAAPEFSYYVVSTRKSKLLSQWRGFLQGFLKGFRGYVFQDDPVKLYGKLSNRLARGQWVQFLVDQGNPQQEIPAEGELAPSFLVSRGLVRLSLLSMENAGWRLPFHIYPVSLVSEDPRFWRSRVDVRWGHVLDPGSYKPHEAESWESVEDRLRADLSKKLVDLSQDHHLDFSKDLKTYATIYESRFFHGLSSVFRGVLLALGFPVRRAAGLLFQRKDQQAALIIVATSILFLCIYSRVSFREFFSILGLFWVSCQAWLWANRHQDSKQRL